MTTRGNKCPTPRKHRPNLTSISASRTNRSPSKWLRRSPKIPTGRTRLTMRRARTPSTVTTTRTTKIRTTRASRSSTRRHSLSLRRTRAITTMATMTATTTTRATRTKSFSKTLASQRNTTTSLSSQRRISMTTSPLTWHRSVRIASRRTSLPTRSESRSKTTWTRWSCGKEAFRSRRVRLTLMTTRRRLKLETTQMASTSAGPKSRQIRVHKPRRRTVTSTFESGYLK